MPGFRPRLNVWKALTVLIAALVTLPVLTVLGFVFVPSPEVWGHLYQTVLSDYVLNTV